MAIRQSGVYPIDMDAYGEEAHQTAFYADSLKGIMPSLVYSTLGLVGEAGEVAEKVKKRYRDNGGVWSPEDRLLFLKELGDVLWYLNEAALACNSHLGEVATINLKKLRERTERNTLQGSGDSR